MLIGLTVQGFVAGGSRGDRPGGGDRAQTRSLDSRRRKARGWLFGSREKMSSPDREWPHSSQGLTAAKVWSPGEVDAETVKQGGLGNLHVIPPVAGANAILLARVRGVEGQT